MVSVPARGCAAKLLEDKAAEPEMNHLHSGRRSLTKTRVTTRFTAPFLVSSKRRFVPLLHGQVLQVGRVLAVLVAECKNQELRFSREGPLLGGHDC